MVFSVVFVAIAVASVSAQESDLTSQDGTIVARSINGMRQVRQQEINSFELSEAVNAQAALITAQAADISTLREVISTMMGPSSPVTAAVQAVAADMTARTMGLMSTASENAANLATVSSNLDGLTDSVAGQLSSAMAAQTAARAEMTAAAATAQAEMAATLSTTATSMARSMTDMSARNTAQISSAIATSASQGTALQSTLTRTIAGINSTMIASVAMKANEAQHLWLGGCTSGGGGCWRDQCLNGVELDTARPKFYKRTNYRMRTLITGFFRMNLWLINSGNWAHMGVMINGARKSQTYMHTYHGWWKDVHQDHTHLISAGQDFWFQTCGHTHGWSGGQSHHRQEYMWVGTRPS